jgi:hypothetical protein
MPTLHKALLSYPVGSKKYSGLLNALRALTANFGKEESAALTPAAAQQITQAAKMGGPMSGGAPPPGLTPNPGAGMMTPTMGDMPGGGM